MTTSAIEHITLLDERLRFVWRRGGRRIHIQTGNARMRDLKALCGRTLDQQKGHEIVMLSERWFTTEEICVRCLTRARQDRPGSILSRPYTDAVRAAEYDKAAMLLDQFIRNLSQLSGIELPPSH